MIHSSTWTGLSRTQRYLDVVPRLSRSFHYSPNTRHKMIPITRSSITLARAATSASAPAFAAGLRQAAYPTARAWSSTPAVSAKGKMPDKLK